MTKIINSTTQFNAFHSGKRNIGKTKFIQELAFTIGTTDSYIYNIIKDATIVVKDSILKEYEELSKPGVINNTIFYKN